MLLKTGDGEGEERGENPEFSMFPVFVRAALHQARVPGGEDGRHAMLREEKRQRMELNAVRFSTQNDENVLLVVGMPVASQGSSPVATGAIRISIAVSISQFHIFYDSP